MFSNNNNIKDYDSSLPNDDLEIKKLFFTTKLQPTRELSVFTNAKKLGEYIFTITKNSPKHYRWSFISKLHNLSLELIQTLYQSNLYRNDKRLELQYKSDTILKLIDYMAELSAINNAITHQQSQNISKIINECRKTLWGWIKM